MGEEQWLQEGRFRELREELLGLFRQGVESPLPEEEFNRLALRVFSFQYRANPPYRAFADRRGRSPDRVDRWQEIPALPTRAFKAAPLVAGPPGDVEAVFRTSGTTLGRQKRGEHHVRSLDLYRASLTPNFRAHLLPEGEPLPVLALLPSPQHAPDSSLSFMVGEAAGWWKGEGGGFFVDPDRGIREEDFLKALREAERHGSPVLLAGTAFALARWLDVAKEETWQVTLPEGSRIMETGGYKGRARALSREDLYRGLQDAFGVPPGRVVNEYGMTELLSQFYETVLAEAAPLEDDGASGSSGAVDPGARPRFHRGPPWVRTLALHPMTLQPVPTGEVGILSHLDLANLGSVVRILTEDLGILVPGGFVLVGRNAGAEPRGCSLAMEDFMTGLGG